MRFTLHPFATIATVLLLPCLVYLSTWQWNRYTTKLDLQKQLENNINLPAIPHEQLNSTASAQQHWRYRTLQLTGHYVDKTILLHARRGKNRYQVFTAFQPDHHPGLIFVEQGKISNAKDIPSPPSGKITLKGVLDLPQWRLKLSKSPKTIHWPWITSAIRLQEAAESIKQPIYPWLVMRDQAPFKDIHLNIAQSSKKHFGYAVQWLMMAIGLLGYYLYLGFSRHDKHTASL